MFELLGTCLALAALLALNLVGSLGAALLWRALAPRASRWSATSRSQVLFALGVMPLLASLFLVAFLLLPSFLIHEPRHETEELSPALVVFALVSAAGLCRAAWRALASWAATRRLLRDWTRRAAPLELVGLPVSAYVLRHEFPMIALVGVTRPRLFVAEQVLGVLGGDELKAAIEHEAGHLRSRDNLKRVVLAACGDTLPFAPFARALERAWRQASEEAADEYAARAGASVALDLAAALIKVARMVPAGARPVVPAGALFTGETGEVVAARVERLLRLADASGATVVSRGRARLAWSSLAAITVITAALIDYEITEATHAAIEHFVASLQ